MLECDPSRDLAIVQLDHVPETAKAVNMAQMNPAPGQTLHSIGNPAIGHSMWLYRSAKVRQTCHRRTPLSNSQLILDATVIQTQSGINQGDSGGPVVNDLGELVGISQGHQPSANSFGYCVAISELRALMETGTKARDHRVVQLLEAATLDFQFDTFGRFITHVENSWGEPRRVSLDSLTFEHNGMHFRNIWLEVRLADAALPHSVERGIMAWNRDANGPWKVVGHRDVWVKTYIPADATPEELHMAITRAEPHIDTMRSEITALLRRVQPTLTGDWIATAGSQPASGIQLTLSSTGNGLWREGLFSMSGPYVIQNGILAITRSSGQQFPLGQIEQTKADELILHVGSSQIRFVRQAS